MTKAALTRSIKEKALEIGFTKVGITSAEPFDHAADHLASWIERGFHGLMQYMERGHEKRRDVKQILPSARSIISLAVNYKTEHDPNTDTLKISRYAWGTDYHEVIPAMLEQLLQEIKLIAPEVEGRYYVDTGPLLEKAIAQRAGIGWMGKHSNVITREVGSWVFLAEILLNLDLEYDAPHQDFCGTCTKCIEACPTDAITQPYVVDATKCISYLTIELKAVNEIPQPQAEQLNGWLYGCDICQEVCPWNRFGKDSSNENFQPRLENTQLQPAQLEVMEQEEFSRRFRKSPIKRTKLAGLKRNLKALQQSLRSNSAARTVEGAGKHL